MKYASLGSVSSGTMRNEDLLGTFASELEYHVKRNAEWFAKRGNRRARNKLLKLAREANEITDYDSETASEIVSELFDALEQFAPSYAYFGAHDGDGADYGFWISEDAMSQFDGLKVDDTSKVPADYRGEVLHCNDHGNLTLYVADRGKLTEVWGIV